MCGRYTLRTPQGVLVERFRVNALSDYVPRYNVAPTQQVGVVRQTASDQRQFLFMQWGLIPRWANHPKIGSQMINARAESAAEKRFAMLSAVGYLVVADGIST